MCNVYFTFVMFQKDKLNGDILIKTLTLALTCMSAAACMLMSPSDVMSTPSVPISSISLSAVIFRSSDLLKPVI